MHSSIRKFYAKANPAKAPGTAAVLNRFRGVAGLASKKNSARRGTSAASKTRRLLMIMGMGLSMNMARPSS
jgi:hypothetical protein